LERKYPSVLTESVNYIRKAILWVFTGKHVALETELDEQAHYTVDNLLQVGLFSIHNERLHCPYILLWLFARRAGADIPELLDIDFCTYGEQQGHLGVDQWQHFQRFVLLFQAIKSRVYCGEVHTAKELYCGAIQSPDLASLSIDCVARRLVIASQQLESRSGFYPANTKIQHESGSTNIGDCTVLVENAYGASAGDAFGAVRLANSGTVIHEVVQDKQYGASVPRERFDHEHQIAVTPGTDIFVFVTTGKLVQNFLDTQLPPRSVVVSAQQFKEYFGLFAGRAFIAAKVNINAATRKQLLRVPYISEKLAQKILEERESNGPFTSREEYEQRTGIRNTLKRKHSEFLTF